VGDLGRSERLAETLRPYYRPAAITPARGSGLLDGPAAPVGPGETPLTYPLERRAQESDPYGWRLAQDRQLWRMHTGLDLIVPEGTAVLAAQAGTVRLVDWVGGYGLTVIVEHGSGWQTLYAHLGEIAVLPGQSLAAGETLGRVGSTGRATTAHLHFEVRRRLEGGTVALDPAPLLQTPAQGAVADRAGSE
jgi:murein DD-endopeptidase MepM/ murein hydrolase activator NlpD